MAATLKAMSDDRFWPIIDRARTRSPDPDAQEQALLADLKYRPLDEIAAFEFAFYEKLKSAYRWDLWGAAYVIHGGASDDGFEYFRRWLVFQGKDVYDAALADPESLAEQSPSMGPEGYWEFETIYYASTQAWTEKGGQGDVRDLLPSWEAGAPDPEGEPFEEDAKSLEKAYPKLWARFGENPLPHD